MISLPITRQYASILQQHLFPYLKMLKQTKLNNVAHLTTQSKEYLSVIMLNCITDELMLHINRKLINSTKDKFKLQLTDAQLVMLFTSLIGWPIKSEEIWMINMRNFLVDEIDHLLTTNLIYQTGVQQTEKYKNTKWWEYYEE